MESGNRPQLAQLVRRSRLTAGWSQEVLAERSGLSVRLISDLERGARTLPRLESIRMLADTLELTADQRADLIAAARPELQDGFASPSHAVDHGSPAVHAVDDQLPEPSNSFIGREQEVMELAGIIQRGESRLITLTGPGGVGKTRLALRVASEIAGDAGRKVRIVQLAPVTDSANVVSTIGLALGVRGRADDGMIDRIAATIGDESTLLVLDNFERLVDAGPVLPELLSRCPGLTMLVTSRAVLRLTVERIFPVRPLELSSHTASVPEILNSPAVRLFLDRSSQQGRLPNGDPAELFAVAAICRRLDGLPLAIELAAARTRVFDAQQLAEHLESGIAILRHGPRDAPARLQSMHDMIAWSYDLLAADEQALFRTLSVFAGGFTFRSAADLFRGYGAPTGHTRASMTAADFDALVADLILSLIDQSLVEQCTTDDGHPRFMLLETIREFGRQLLSVDGEAELVCKLHAEQLAALARTRKPYLISQPKAEADDPLHREHDNVRAAIGWSIEQGAMELAGWLACGLWPFCYRNGLYAEAQDMFERVLGASEALPPPLHADLLHNGGLNAHLRGNAGECHALALQALPIYESLGNQTGVAHCLCLTGLSTTNSDPACAASDFARAAEILRSLDDYEALSYALDGLGTALMHVGDVAGAKAAFTESMAADMVDAKRCGFAPLGWAVLAEGDLDLASNILLDSLTADPFRISPYNRAYTLCLLGRIAFLRGQHREAARLYHESLSIYAEIGAHHERDQCVAEVAAVAQAFGDSERAVRWLAFDHAQREQRQLRLTPDEASIRASALEQARKSLSESTFAAAWDAGLALSAGKASEEALAWRPDELNEPKPASGLTRRETQVLRLLTDQRTNQEIADALFLSPRTIESHVASILAKLDVHTRNDAVAVARERNLIAP